MKTLFAGPFVGEFGWELFCWQGILRKYCEVSNFDKVIISSRKSTEFLYKDFYDEHIEYEPDVYEPDSFFDTDIKILLHSRNTSGAGGQTSIRNWDKNKFENVVSHFSNIKFASIGTKQAANHIRGTKDLRDKNVVDYMASADLIIGPSSGPMHLASLCGLKQLAWGVENNINRYKYDWNPHNTETQYIVSENWNPDIKEVIENMEILL